MAQGPVEKSIVSQRLSLSVAEWGAPAQPLCILVHGGRDQKRSWDTIARHLSDRYFVITYDLRGHGASDWVSDGDYGVMDHVFDLASIVEAYDRPKTVLIGHSLGGNIALRFSGLYPERIEKLVAIEGLGPSPKMQAARQAEDPADRARGWIKQRRSLSDRTPRVMTDLSEAQERMRAAHPHLTEAQLVHLTRHGVRQNSDGSYSWCYDPAGMGPSPSDIPHAVFIALWEAITCPTWLVYGADSWASDPSRDGRAAHFRAAEVTVLPDAGHWLHHDQTALFLSGLEAFLAR